MLLERSIVNIADNSGAQRVMLFAVNGKNNRGTVGVGDVVMGSVKSSSPNGKVKKGAKVKILIVRTRAKTTRADGTSISFSDNAAVIVNKELVPVGTRVFGPIAREVRNTGLYPKVVSLAEEVL
jgi:large subunit ribosomal protein L14